MKARIMIGVLALALAAPSIASAKVDTTCSPTTAAFAVAGQVRNADNVPVSGVTVQIYAAGSSNPLPGFAVTDAGGLYHICGASNSDTYNVVVRDLRSAPLYAGASQPYTLLTNGQSDADFTPATGNPLLYATNLTISPANISTALAAATVSWTVRSKAPTTTDVQLTLGHRAGTIHMATAGTDGGGVNAGGWNLWRFTDTFAKLSAERLYWASIAGLDGTTQVTQTDREPYVIDNQGPIFGKASTAESECGPSSGANGFSPVTPPGTTNPQPVVTLGVCDHYSQGARSGLDPFSLTGKICSDLALSTGCTPIDPVLSTFTIVWFPHAPLARGDYYLGFTIADFAGNVTTTSTGYKLTITDHGGQMPTITAPAPSNLGSGSTGGLVLGSQYTSPSSMPYVGFRASDADGQLDLVPGTLQVRVFFGDEHTLIWQYDPNKAQGDFDPATKRGGALFDLSGGGFRATSFSMTGLPGRYVATATISDHGNNTASLTWEWIVVAAA